MKLIAIVTALGALASAAQAATLNTVEVDGSSIPCLFNTNCTNQARERLSSFSLPRTTGTGYLHSRVVFGEAGSPADGHFGYEYRLDLSGLVARSNNPACLLENIRCRTERMEVRTNVVTCTTNNFVCTTNRFPATNIVVCLTNLVPGSNIVVCSTNSAGVVVCSTNSFGGTNAVFCVTNRFTATNMVVCVTNLGGGGTNFVSCITNSVRHFTNVLVCRTNYTACPGSPPFINSLRIKVGPILAQMDLNNDGTNTDQVYVVASGGSGSNAPSAVTWDDDYLVVSFSPPLGVGDSSVTVGIVARGSARNIEAKLKLTSDSTRNLSAIGPRILRFAHCDFSALTTAIQDLRTRDFTGNNNQARERRRAALLELVEAAQEAALDDDRRDLKEAIETIVSKVDGQGSDWVNRDGVRALRSSLRELLDCLNLSGNDRDDDDDDDNRHDRDDRNDRDDRDDRGDRHDRDDDCEDDRD